MSALFTPAGLTRLGVREATAWAPILNAACAKHDIDSPRRGAAFVANVLHETGNLGALVESLNYSAAGLQATWPTRFPYALAQRLGRTPAHAADQRSIAEVAYGGRLGNGPAGSGDGWKFRGRGCLQLTGGDNYRRFAAVLGMPVDDLVAALETREGAANSAAHFWRVTGCNAPADRGDLVTVRRLVNGGAIGLKEVQAKFAAARSIMGG